MQKKKKRNYDDDNCEIMWHCRAENKKCGKSVTSVFTSGLRSFSVALIWTIQCSIINLNRVDHSKRMTPFTREWCPPQRVCYALGVHKAFVKNPWRGQIWDSLEDRQNYLCGLKVIGWQRGLPEERNGRLSTWQSQRASRVNGRKQGKQAREARRHNWPHREGWSNSEKKNIEYILAFGSGWNFEEKKKNQVDAQCSLQS